MNIILETGKMALKMEEELYIIGIVKLNMQVTLLMINLKDKEDIIGKMVNIIKDNLLMDLKMEKGLFTIKIIQLNIKVILLTINMKDKENIFGKMVIIILGHI